MYNDLQYKIIMMDIEPWNKRGKYITYEPGRRVYMDDVKYEDLNVNVICDKSIKTVPPTQFYLLYWIILIILIYVVVKLWKMNFMTEIKRTRTRARVRTRTRN
jgi:hypothetical protein